MVLLQSICVEFNKVGERHSKALTPAREACNKYDLTAAPPVFDWSRCFAITSLLPICSPSFSFMGGVGKRYITKLGCEK